MSIKHLVKENVIVSYKNNIDKFYDIKRHVESCGGLQQSINAFESLHFNSIRCQFKKNTNKLVFVFMNIGIEIVNDELQEEHKLIVSLEDIILDIPYMLKYNLQTGVLTNNMDENTYNGNNILDIMKSEITKWLED